MDPQSLAHGLGFVSRPRDVHVRPSSLTPHSPSLPLSLSAGTDTGSLRDVTAVREKKSQRRVGEGRNPVSTDPRCCRVIIYETHLHSCHSSRSGSCLFGQADSYKQWRTRVGVCAVQLMAQGRVSGVTALLVPRPSQYQI